MGRSLDFIKERIASGATTGMENNYYDVLNELDTPFFNDAEWHTHYLIDQDKKKRVISIRHDPDAQFDYFTMARLLCDGTLFYHELIQEVIDKINYGNTFCISKIPEDYQTNYEKYELKYVVGNFVCGAEHNEQFGTKEKPWLTERETVFLPIKFECELIQEEV